MEGGAIYNTMLLAAGMICVILGFGIKITGMKRIKEDNCLRFGIVKNIEKEKEGYLIRILYSPFRDENTKEVTIKTNRRPNSTELILKEENDSIIIYKGKKHILYSAFGLWILGVLLCVFA